MDGIMFLLNQAGIALAQANAEIEGLRARIKVLEADPSRTAQEDAR